MIMVILISEGRIEGATFDFFNFFFRIFFLDIYKTTSFILYTIEARRESTWMGLLPLFFYASSAHCNSPVTVFL